MITFLSTRKGLPASEVQAVTCKVKRHSTGRRDMPLPLLTARFPFLYLLFPVPAVFCGDTIIRRPSCMIDRLLNPIFIACTGRKEHLMHLHTDKYGFTREGNVVLLPVRARTTRLIENSSLCTRLISEVHIHDPDENRRP